MILVIDNYDSFTYNLVQYLEEQGAEVEVAKNDELELSDVEKMQPQGVVISPGPGNPDQAGITLSLIKAFSGVFPILGVCLGHQAIARAFGGDVRVNWRTMHGKVSPIYHDGRGVLAGMKSPFKATRYHSLVVDASSLPESLEVSARSDQGEVMGIRHRYFPVEGVQFHPESIATECGRTIIANFLRVCGKSGIKN